MMHITQCFSCILHFAAIFKVEPVDEETSESLNCEVSINPVKPTEDLSSTSQTSLIDSVPLSHLNSDTDADDQSPEFDCSKGIL